MSVNQPKLDTTHYETYDTLEAGEFESDGVIYNEKLTYSDGSVCYGRRRDGTKMVVVPESFGSKLKFAAIVFFLVG